MPATVLDPYTRVLASVADIVTKARRSFRTTSVTGQLLVCGVIGCGFCVVGIAVVVTMPFWMPISISLMCMYTGIQACRAVSAGLTRTWRNLLNWGTSQMRALLNPPPAKPNMRCSSIHVQQRAAAIEDRGFLRGIFDGVSPCVLCCLYV